MHGGAASSGQAGDVIRGVMYTAGGITFYHYAVVERTDETGNLWLVHHTGRHIKRISLEAFLNQNSKCHIVLPFRHSPLPPDQIVNTAIGMLGQAQYDRTWWNCEHFPTYCQTGQAESSQTLPLLVGVYIVISLLIGGLLGSTLAFLWLLYVALSILRTSQLQNQIHLFHGGVMQSLAFHTAFCLMANLSSMGVLHISLRSLGLVLVSSEVYFISRRWHQRRHIL